MKRPVARSLNSTWFWIELPENCCEPLKFIMKYISIQFCERAGHGRPFHALTHWPLQDVVIKLKASKLIIQDSNLSTPCDIALQWMPQNLSNDKSTLIQVMFGGHQVASHYPSQCWPRSLPPYGITRSQVRLTRLTTRVTKYYMKSPVTFWILTSDFQNND